MQKSNTNLQYPFDTPPKAGEVQSIVPGISWACMPLPFALDHVNVWILENEESLTLVDAALDNESTRQNWQKILAKFQPQPEHLVVTHYHPDHAGLAGWFDDQWSCKVTFSQAELAQAHKAWSVTDEAFSSGQREWYELNGLDEERIAAMAAHGNSYRPLVSVLPAQAQLLATDDELLAGPSALGVRGTWQVIIGEGHSPEMICLYNKELNILIAGDQVLPKITPNIMLSWYLEDKNPMRSFLSSLDRFSGLPDDVLVLPSHGRPFVGLHQRIADVRLHHEERFQSILDVCQTPQTGTDLLPHLFRRELDIQQLMFGMGESLAHLQYLHDAGNLELREINGIRHYITVDSERADAII